MKEQEGASSSIKGNNGEEEEGGESRKGETAVGLGTKTSQAFLFPGKTL